MSVCLSKNPITAEAGNDASASPQAGAETEVAGAVAGVGKDAVQDAMQVRWS